MADTYNKKAFKITSWIYRTLNKKIIKFMDLLNYRIYTYLNFKTKLLLSGMLIYAIKKILLE